MLRSLRSIGATPWPWLIVLALLLVVSTRHSLAWVLRGRDPEAALRFAPNDAAILATVAARTAQSQIGSPPARAQAARQARAALLREPGNVSAAATLGLIAAADGKPSVARAFFAYSAQRSRRNLSTQLWLIEDAVARDSVPDALSHYDIALRTSSSAPAILFPVLISAIGDPQIRAGLIPVFRRAPSWKDAFEIALAQQTRDFPAAANLFAMMAAGGVAPSAASENILLSNMVTAGQIDGAWRYYRLRHPQSDPLQPRNAAFSPAGSDGSPFDWGLVNDNGISSSLGGGGERRGGALSFTVSPSIAGVVAQQVQKLPAGRYRLSGHSRAIRQEAKDYLRWDILCSDGRPLGRAVIAASDAAPAAFAADFEVPANCSAQLLRLVALPSDDVAGITGQMLDIRISRRGS